MSLPPVQSPLPEVQKKTPIVTKPEPAHNEQQRGFKGSMDSARQDQTDQANKRANTDKQSGDVKVANKEASDNGNDLPPED
jgi:hypothetical protein